MTDEVRMVDKADAIVEDRPEAPSTPVYKPKKARDVAKEVEEQRKKDLAKKEAKKKKK